MIEKIRNLLFRIFKKESFFGKIIDKVFTEEIILYIVFGALTTLVNFTATVLLKKFVFTSEQTGEFTLCNAIAWGISVVFAFFTNKLFVFKSRSFAPAVFAKEFISFVAARALTGVLEIVLPEALMKAGLDQTLFGVKGMVAKIAVSVFVIVLNYVFSKLVSFRKKEETTSEETEIAEDGEGEEI
ncbi:MAG: GtrA family protein [Clostridia bacterium]|nr:GtrA family protein [Clostridia bacterium]